MDYIKTNKEAWEEAFEHRKEGWHEDLPVRLQNEPHPFLTDELIEELRSFDFPGKTIAQFCCNNGRELLSVMKFGAAQGFGFDIAENMVAWANDAAQKTNTNCRFIASDILAIDESYNNRFDLILITIGAIGWFKDLVPLFKKIAGCLKPGGTFILQDMHPVINMLAFAGEPNYDEQNPEKLVNSYFRKEPWIETDGIGYMCGQQYDSKTFTSYSYTFADVVTALTVNGLSIRSLCEFQHDLSGSVEHLNIHGIPLSYLLLAKK